MLRVDPRRWRAAAYLLLAVEAVALFWAYVTFNVEGQIHQVVSSPVLPAAAAQLSALVQALLPSGYVAALQGFLSGAGLMRPAGQAIALGTSLASGVSLSSLEGAVVAPTYFAARMLLRTAKRPTRARAPDEAGTETALQDLGRTLQAGIGEGS